MQKPFSGCWPTMITPFTADNKIDFAAVRQLTEWFIARGCDGIFAVCQSSEMFFLDEQEKRDLAKAVLDAAAGRVKVIPPARLPGRLTNWGRSPKPAWMPWSWLVTGWPPRTRTMLCSAKILTISGGSSPGWSLVCMSAPFRISGFFQRRF